MQSTEQTKTYSELALEFSNAESTCLDISIITGILYEIVSELDNTQAVGRLCLLAIIQIDKLKELERFFDNSQIYSFLHKQSLLERDSRLGEAA